MITILGPTATGKTTLAAHLAHKLNGEIISADSRQVYKGMDLGTGKDLEDYIINGNTIPYHLIDIVDPGYEYNVYEFQKDFLTAYQLITSNKKLPILCGGTGMYIEAVLQGYKLVGVPDNNELREKLSRYSDKELTDMLHSYRHLHNITDITDKKRLIRAIEIQEYYRAHPDINTGFPKIDSIIFGISYERSIIRSRITTRLNARLKEGMIDEVKGLLNSGITQEQLKFYGLEYKFITQYVIGEISYDELFRLLNTAIHQFAKRQMTWFRKMEKRGYKINWIDGNMPIKEKVKIVIESPNRK